MAYTEHVVEITETVNMPEVILQSMFSRILTFSGWQGWLNANRYKYALPYLDADIKDACYSSNATLPLGNKKSIFKKSAKWSLFLDHVTYHFLKDNV